MLSQNINPPYSKFKPFQHLVKEHLINVDGQTLDIGFVPSTKAPKTCAFVNGLRLCQCLIFIVPLTIPKYLLKNRVRTKEG